MNVPIIYRIRGPLDVAALERAFTGLVARHEALRTKFSEDGGELLQHIHAPEFVGVEVIDVSGAPNPLRAASQGLQTRLTKHIDVRSAFPFTIDLYRLGHADHVLMINVHHLITDEWSTRLLCRDVSVLYNSALGDTTDTLPPVEWSFRHYANDRRKNSQEDPGRPHLEYWRDQLDGMRYLESAPVPHRNATGRPPSNTAWFQISSDRVGRLQALAEQHSTQLAVVMESLFFAALYAISGQKDISCGSIVSKREKPQIHNTIGCFTNLVVLRARFAGNPSIADVIRSVSSCSTEATRYQDYSYGRLVEDPSVSSARMAMDTAFHMLDVPSWLPAPNGASFEGLEIETLPVPLGMGSRYDLQLLLVPHEDRIGGVCRFTPDRYEKSFVQKIVALYKEIIDTAISDPYRVVPRPEEIRQHIHGDI